MYSTDLGALFKKQRKLDDFVLEQHGIKDEESLKVHRRLALYDEIAELLNKTRVHKYWSNKPMEARDDLLEEYVDGWHFLLMIGNDLQMPPLHEGIDQKDDLVSQFDAIMFTASIVYSPIGWYCMVSLYKGLGALLGFDWERDILTAYDKKYEINIERQKNGY